MLKYAKKRHQEINIAPVKGADVLYEIMHRYRTEMRLSMTTLRDAFKNFKMDERIKAAEIKSLLTMIVKLDEFVVDIAHKLAPYQTPKLESIEVRNKVEHRFVLRAPDRVNSVDEWMKKTGADRLQIEHIPAKPKQDNKEESSFEDDELETYNKGLLN